MFAGHFLILTRWFEGWRGNKLSRYNHLQALKEVKPEWHNDIGCEVVTIVVLQQAVLNKHV